MATNTTTKKFNSFISRPLQDCTINDVPGVGKSVASKLLAANIETPDKLLGMYFVCDRDPEKMKRWLMTACDIRAQEAGKISKALERKSQAAMIC